MEIKDETYVVPDNTQTDFTKLDITEIPDTTEIVDVATITPVVSSDNTSIDNTQIDVDLVADATSMDKTGVDNTKFDSTALDFDVESVKTLKKTNFGHIKKATNNLTFAPRTTPLQDVRDYVLSTITLERFKSLKRPENPQFSSSYYKVVIVGAIVWVLCWLGAGLL